MGPGGAGIIHVQKCPSIFQIKEGNRRKQNSRCCKGAFTGSARQTGERNGGHIRPDLVEESARQAVAVSVPTRFATWGERQDSGDESEQRHGH